METNQDNLEPRGDEQLGEREQWESERWITAAHQYIQDHRDEWDELLVMVDPDWQGHYWDMSRAMADYREAVAEEVAHLLEIGELE